MRNMCAGRALRGRGAAGGGLDPTFAGPYVPTTRGESGEVEVSKGASGADRRSIYLQQRRTQTVSMLNVFDAPTPLAVPPKIASSKKPIENCRSARPFVRSHSLEIVSSSSR